TLAFLVILSSARLSAASSDTKQTEETRLIATLQSKVSSPREKDAACAQLKIIGTERSVKALAKLLTDSQLSHSARYALESMPNPKAGQVLRAALGRTSGLPKVGIINSLAMRRDSDAVSKLGKLLSDSDQVVAVAAAEALGRIGGPSALKRLQGAAPSSNGPVHEAEIDGILTCAQGLLASGKAADALKIFQGIYASEKNSQARQAAFRGMILASGDSGLALAAGAIANGDADSRSAALLVAPQLKVADTTRTLANLTPKVGIPIQMALIECFVRRIDPAAQAAVAGLANSPDAGVRVAAISALGSLGDASVVHLLADKAVTTTGAERSAARQSLLELNRGPVTQQIIRELESSWPEAESELIKALGGRGDQAACPELLKLARDGKNNERTDALQALGALADASRIPELVQLVSDAGTDDLRSQAADALSAVYQRMPTTSDKLDLDALLKAVRSGSVETRVALLPVCSELAQEPVRDALRAAATDGDARIHDAGIHALCETQDPGLLPDLLNLAAGQGGDSAQHLAVRGCVRLTTQEENVKLSNDKKLDTLTRILGTPLDADEKRLVLSGLATIADDRALPVAAGMLDDDAAKAEAEQAVIHIAESISKQHPAEARDALKKVLAAATDDAVKKAVQTALKKIQ
ncbi:MAG TPA: HEAT repeat domain-containing protein, partial [Verrucomicrobiae bacterium]|nr:HEAT repeat domain-containing protein [Verrucomicrobiae bacterium]